MINKILTGYNMDIHQQLKVLESIKNSSPMLKEALDRADTSGLDNYYIGAGCIAQTVWNYLFDYDLEYGIKDIDFIYYDDKRMDYESEDNVIISIKKLYSDFKKDIDVKNQARVHLWYKDHFGYEITPYDSLEAAINTWPTTATAIGVYIPTEKHHLHGHLEPVSRRVRATLTETEPPIIFNSYQFICC